MTCSQCGGNVADGAAACPACGAPTAAQNTQYAQYGGSGGFGGGPRAGAFDFRPQRWTLNDRITGAATLLTMISLFLPWFNATVSSRIADFTGGSASASGTTVHGWLWFVFVIGLLVLGFLVLLAGYDAPPFNLPARPAQLLIGATGLNLLLVFIGFIAKPSGDSTIGISVGWDIGAFIGLLAAIAAVVPLVMTARAQRS